MSDKREVVEQFRDFSLFERGLLKSFGIGDILENSESVLNGLE